MNSDLSKILKLFAVPSEKSDSPKSILTRAEIQERVAPQILAAFRAGQQPTTAELAKRALGDAGYPTASGATKSVGDALGHNAHGLRLHFAGKGKVRAVRRCKENVSLILESDSLLNKIETIVLAAGFDDLGEVTPWFDSLPSALPVAG